MPAIVPIAAPLSTKRLILMSVSPSPMFACALSEARRCACCLAAEVRCGGGRLAALPRAGQQRKRSHGDPVGPSRKDQRLAGIEAGERFACAARRADAQELGRTAGHATSGACDGVEVTVYGTRANLGDDGSKPTFIHNGYLRAATRQRQLPSVTDLERALRPGWPARADPQGWLACRTITAAWRRSACLSGRTVTDVISSWWHPAVAPITLA